MKQGNWTFKQLENTTTYVIQLLIKEKNMQFMHQNSMVMIINSNLYVLQINGIHTHLNWHGTH